MKIKKLDIYGYGKWVNQQFDIDDHLQLFYGRNEAGKSTLQSFIRSMLFGFPTKRRKVNQQNRYEPKNSEVYGGRLLLTETDFGDVWVERTNKDLTITKTDGEVLPNKTLEEILGGLDETLYDNFYAFNLQNLQELSNVDAQQLSDYFLSIGTVGSDKFLKVAKQLEKETDDLYRPQGQSRVLNQELAQYDEMAKKVAQTKLMMDRYDGLVKSKEAEEKAIQIINEQITNYEQKLRELDKLLGRYDIYLKDRTITRELEQLIYTPIPENGLERLNTALKDNKQAKEEIIQLKERILQLTEEIKSLTRVNWANNHQEQRRIWVVETQKAKDVQTKIEQLESRIQEQEESMTQLAIQGQFYPEKIKDDQTFEQQMQEGFVIQTKKLDLSKQKEAIKAEKNVFLSQRKEQQQYSITVRQQVAQLEAQRLNQEDQLVQDTSLKHYFVGVLFFLTGLTAAIINLVTANNSKLFLLIGLVFVLLGLVVMAYVFSSHRKHFETFRKNPIVDKIQELREKESSYYEQSKLMGIQINQREEMLAELESEIENVRNQQQEWLKLIGFYPTADPEFVLKANPVKAYLQSKEMKLKFVKNRDQLSNQIAQWKNLIQPLLDRFPVAVDASETRYLIRHIEDTEVDLAKNQEKGKLLQERIEETKDLIKKNQAFIQSNSEVIHSMFDETQSKNELDFNLKVEANARIKDLNTKHELYQEQMTGYEEALSQIDNKQSLVEEYHRLEHELEMTKDSLAPHHHERANLIVEINHLEQDGTYLEQVQQLENKKAQIKELIYEWGHKRLAMELIYRTLRQGLDNPVPEMNRLADDIFATLSYGRYTQIKLNKTGIKVKQFSDILFEPHELSQGTLEQLYVALRIAFVQNAKNMVKMPIIIDDAFVNFDEIRKTSMYQVLEKISKDIQVLFFTFDLQAKESFKDDIRIDLELSDQSEIKPITE